MCAIPAQSTVRSAKLAPVPRRDGKLRKHADYQRVYREGKRQSLPLITYFFAARRASDAVADAIGPAIPLNGMGAPPAEMLRESRLEPRVGLTAGKVLGNAVERNRIKRRMREAVRQAQAELTASVDVVLHPRRAVLEAEFSEIERDVARAFRAVELAMKKTRDAGSSNALQR
ncbi:MAG: ribonuclease P protein component [Acidobacteriaceae bacterium]